MAARSLIIDLLKSPNGTFYGVLIAFFIVILTTGLSFELFKFFRRAFLLVDLFYR